MHIKNTQTQTHTHVHARHLKEGSRDPTEQHTHNTRKQHDCRYMHIMCVCVCVCACVCVCVCVCVVESRVISVMVVGDAGVGKSTIVR